MANPTMTESDDLYGTSAFSAMKQIIATHQPRAKKALLLMRHGERPRIVPGSGSDVPLTNNGKFEAKQLGYFAGTTPSHVTRSKLKQGRLLHSPFVRCKETLQFVAAGANWDIAQVEENLNIRFFVQADPQVRELGPFPFVQQFVADKVSVDGVGNFTTWFQGFSKFLKQELRSAPPNSLSVFTSHDDMVMFTVCGIFGIEPTDRSMMPGFLEGIYIFVDNEGNANAAFRDHFKKDILRDA